MIMGDDGRVLKTLGKTPLEIPIDDAISGDAGTITVQKKDYMRVSTLVSKGSLGATKQIYRIKLSPGMSGSSLASNLMKQIRLAQNYLSLKDFENAHKAVDQALEWDPTFTFGVSFKAGIFFVQKKYPQAKELYQRVLVQDPNETEASRMLRKIEEQTSGANP